MNDKGRGSKNEQAEPSDYGTGLIIGKGNGKEEQLGRKSLRLKYSSVYFTHWKATVSLSYSQ